MNIIDLINTPQKDLILSDQQIQQLTLEEAHQRHLMLQETLSGVLDYDIVISDTNVWLELNAASYGDNRGNTRLMFERQLDFISKMMRHRGGKFIIMGETYEEIDRFAAVQDPVNHKEADFSDNLVYLNAAARLAKRLILSMQRENRLRIEGISSESHHAAFADPAIVRRVVELFTEGKKVLLLTNDASVAIRSIALCDDLQRINAISDEEWNATYTQLRPMAFTFDDLRLLDNYTRQYHYIQMADGKPWMSDVQPFAASAPRCSQPLAPLTIDEYAFRQGDKHRGDNLFIKLEEQPERKQEKKQQQQQAQSQQKKQQQGQQNKQQQSKSQDKKQQQQQQKKQQQSQQDKQQSQQDKQQSPQDKQQSQQDKQQSPQSQQQQSQKPRQESSASAAPAAASSDVSSASVTTEAPVPDGSPSGAASIRYNAGTTLTLTATPAKGHYFVRWVDANGKQLSTQSAYTFTLNTDQTVKAQFPMIDNYHADLTAFPGAEGYGRFTTGGRMIDNRGAKVYYVTRNDDCPDNALVEGTLRWALRTGDDTPRTILFRTCGTIYLTSKLALNHPNITIAGQTAPGGGICIAGYQMKLSQPNIIIRHIRFRSGDLTANSMSPLDVENTHHIVLDHCSLSWSMEENLTLYDCDSTTMQWCISAEGLYYSKNVKGERSYAMQWGGEHGTMHHCLISNSMSRTPRFNGVRPNTHDRQADNEFANNVIFNWGSHNSVYGGECSTGSADDYDRVYMVNNYFRPGPATKNGAANKRYFVSASGDNIDQVGQWYLSGNKFETSSRWAPATSIWSDVELQKVNQDNYYGFVGDNTSRAMNFWSVSPSQTLADKALLHELPYALSGLTYETADEAFLAVTQRAGASLPRYDEVDRRLLDEAAGRQDPQFHGGSFTSPKNGNTVTPAAGIINSPADIRLSRADEFYALDEAAGQTVKTQMWPWLGMDEGEQLMQDTDLDGMPDDYERSVGLNPTDPTDGSLLTTTGYSNLEVFLNGVADGTIDLTPYKRPSPVTRRPLFDVVVVPAASERPAVLPQGLPTFPTIAAAIAAAEQQATKDSPYYILVTPGIYNEHVEINKPYIHLTGQSRDRVVITDNKNKDDNGNIGKIATVYVNANDVTLDNLTIRNTYGSGKQALALYTLGDRVSVTQCRIEGWQDTYRTGRNGQRHLVRECVISGTTDFIYNAGDVFFDRDTLLLTNTTNVIVAPTHITPQWGYVFRDAYIAPVPGSSPSGSPSSSITTDLGRPWGDTPKTSFIDTRLAPNVAITPAGWRDMGGLPTQMAEYNTRDANDNPIDLSQRKTQFTADGKTAASKAVLTAAEAATYTVQNVLGGTDQWQADATGRILDAPTLTTAPNQLKWHDQTGQAACFLLVIDGQCQVLTADELTFPDGATPTSVSVQSVSEYGVLGRPAALSPSSPDTAVFGFHEDTDPSTPYTLGGLRQSTSRRGLHIIKGKKFINH